MNLAALPGILIGLGGVFVAVHVALASIRRERRMRPEVRAVLLLAGAAWGVLLFALGQSLGAPWWLSTLACAAAGVTHGYVMGRAVNRASR